MGWANCGHDSQGREIGYAHSATCDFPGCKTKIDRGISYVCGEMHGNDEYSCEKYFCEKHKQGWIKTDQGNYLTVCADCEKLWRDENPELAKALDDE